MSLENSLLNKYMVLAEATSSKRGDNYLNFVLLSENTR